MNIKFDSAAQDEISSLDILVCGTCQLVYHFVEEFKEHKAKKNCGASLLRVNISVSSLSNHQSKQQTHNKPFSQLSNTNIIYISSQFINKSILHYTLESIEFL